MRFANRSPTSPKSGLGRWTVECDGVAVSSFEHSIKEKEGWPGLERFAKPRRGTRDGVAVSGLVGPSVSKIRVRWMNKGCIETVPDTFSHSRSGSTQRLEKSMTLYFTILLTIPVEQSSKHGVQLTAGFTSRLIEGQMTLMSLEENLDHGENSALIGRKRGKRSNRHIGDGERENTILLQLTDFDFRETNNEKLVFCFTPRLV